MINIDNSNIMALKMSKPISKHFNFSLFGIHILAMSKRIMNEVMCLADDLGMKIYYQDTDSMHIENFNLERLAYEFKIKYGRELIGTQLGQFHSDFDAIAPNSTNVRARESYFVGKKCYIDELIDDQGNVGHHIRMKGIPKASELKKFPHLPIICPKIKPNENISQYFKIGKLYFFAYHIPPNNPPIIPP